MSSIQSEKQETRCKYWQSHVSHWKSSGMSQRAYCLENKIALSTFTYWHRKFKKKVEEEQPQFYPLTLQAILNVGNDSKDSGLRLLLQEGKYCIDIEEDFSSTALQKLVQALEEC